MKLSNWDLAYIFCQMEAKNGHRSSRTSGQKAHIGWLILLVILAAVDAYSRAKS